LVLSGPDRSGIQQRKAKCGGCERGSIRVPLPRFREQTPTL